MSTGDFTNLIERILRDDLNLPDEEYSEREDTFSLTGFIENEPREYVGNDCTEIKFMSTACYQCNGYYGPCFEDPLCATCHSFLYPVSQPSDIPTCIPEQNSDSDSGNDEPIETIFRINSLDNCEESSQRLPFIHRPAVSTSSSIPEGENFFLSHFSSIDIHFKPYELTSNQVESDAQITLPGCSGVNNQTWTPPPVIMDKLAVHLERLSVHSPRQFYPFNFDLFPPEVLIHTFQYLDEISLWTIGQVCSRWRSILFMYVKPEKWRQFAITRWPLLVTRNMDQDWYELYTAMMKSSCCFKCVQQMAAQELPTNWENNSWRAHRLRTELRVMRTDPLDGIEAIPLDTACFHWQATMEGPAGSSYEGGLFFLYIQVPVSYPLTPPIVRFVTKIFHPNVSRHGDIGIDSIHQNWSLALTMSKLLISIQSLLTDPFCDVCMEPEICKLYMTNRGAFEDQARRWTAKYAMHDILPH